MATHPATAALNIQISATEYAARRARLAQAIGPDAVAIVINPGEVVRSHDTHYAYRAASDMLYLCGFDEPEAVLVLAPDHAEGAFQLFVRPRDPAREQWDGLRAGPEGAMRDYGADAAHNLDQLDARLPGLVDGRQAVFTTLGQHAGFDRRLFDMLERLRHRRSPPPAAPTQLHELRGVLHEMRLLKSPAELAIMRRSCLIASRAHELAMRATRPGLREYQLQALIEHHFQDQGATAPAYNSIVGGGDRATILHYTTNRRELGEHELVLVDAGCELHGYASDITRTWPVNGRFSGPQRDLYEGTLAIQLDLLEAAKPGVLFEDLATLYTLRTIEVMRDLGLVSGSNDAIIESKAHRVYSPHSFGHWLGLDVHDVSPYHLHGVSRPLEPGMVLTIEPGIYVPLSDTQAPEALRGHGVRIEDDLFITSQGHENLTASCPKTIAEIEAVVGQG